MKTTVWGCRGSLATPGDTTLRYGGNTTSVEVRTSSGRLVVLDAGTGIRPLGLSLGTEHPRQIDLLLTHLHLDHVEGLGFFAPLFDPECSITVWGPGQEGSSLAARTVAVRGTSRSSAISPRNAGAVSRFTPSRRSISTVPAPRM